MFVVRVLILGIVGVIFCLIFSFLVDCCLLRCWLKFLCVF